MEEGIISPRGSEERKVVIIHLEMEGWREEGNIKGDTTHMGEEKNGQQEGSDNEPGGGFSLGLTLNEEGLVILVRP